MTAAVGGGYSTVRLQYSVYKIGAVRLETLLEPP